MFEIGTLDFLEFAQIESLWHVIAQENSRGFYYVYRGECRNVDDIKPRVGRYYSNPEKSSRNEQEIFSEFKRQAALMINDGQSDLQKLILAQHYGLSTRLLDWTKNILVAAYFATLNHDNSDDSTIWCLKILEGKIGIATSSNIFVNEDYVEIIHPPIIDQRISAQASVLTLHKNPTKNFCETVFEARLAMREKEPVLHETSYDDLLPRLDKIVIPARLKQSLKEELIKLNIHNASMFPGLEGICSHLNYNTYLHSDVSFQLTL